MPKRKMREQEVKFHGGIRAVYREANRKQRILSIFGPDNITSKGDVSDIVTEEG